jgi:2-methylcitrate dehydratase PrpD
MATGTTEKLVKFVMDTTYDDLPKDVVEIAKNVILDCVGTMLVGGAEQASQMTVRYVKAGGGVPEVGVVGFGFKTSLENATFANGVLTHSAELEALSVPVSRQPMAFSNPQSIVAAALTVAGKLNSSGKQLIEGFVLGHEFQARFSLGSFNTFQRGLCPLSLYGPPSIAALTSKMLGLSSDQARMAVGGAMSWAGGFNRQTGTMLHYLEAGIGSRNGVTAAMLAQQGITADPSLIEGKQGFCEVFTPGNYDLELMTKEIGNPYVLGSRGVNMKRHSCCGLMHPTLEILQALVADNGLHYDDIERLNLHTTRSAAEYLRAEEKVNTPPQNGSETRFDLQWAHGIVLADGKTSFSAFTDAAVAQPKYQDARKKVSVIVDESDWSHGRVELELKGGRTVQGGREMLKGAPRGWAKNPFSREELVARYKSMGEGVLSPASLQRSADLMLDLENVAEVGELMDLLTYNQVAAAA